MIKHTMEIYDSRIFDDACKHGQLEKAQHMLAKDHRIYKSSVCNGEIFRLACANGHLEVAQWLYKINPSLKILAKNEYAFQMACNGGHLLVAQWLYQVKSTPNILAHFINACRNGHLEIVRWLYKIKHDKHDDIQNNPDKIYITLKSIHLILKVFEEKNSYWRVVRSIWWNYDNNIYHNHHNNNYDNMWNEISTNPDMFTYNYDKIAKDRWPINREIIQNRFHPKNIKYFSEWGFKEFDEDVIDE